MRATLLLSAAPLIIVVVSCSGGDRAPLHATASPAVMTGPSAIVTSSSPDVSGSWNWSGEGRLTIPSSDVERLIGIPPEGPITHVRCEATGTMELSQSGQTFTGVAIRNISPRRCETGAGRVLELPLATFPNTLPVADGLITGRGVHFLLGVVAGVGCPHHGAIQEVVGATATELRATGRCIVPGHPQSPVPRDPPPGGTSHDTSFVATRP